MKYDPIHKRNIAILTKGQAAIKAVTSWTQAQTKQTKRFAQNSSFWVPERRNNEENEQADKLACWDCSSLHNLRPVGGCGGERILLALFVSGWLRKMYALYLCYVEGGKI